jgi:bifunctional non-homologous end joining protein LigD
MTMSEAEKRQKRKERRDARKGKQSEPQGQRLLENWVAAGKRVQATMQPAEAEIRPMHTSKSGGSFPALIPVMLASDNYADRALTDSSYLIQEKFDGSRVCAIKKDGQIWMITRSWKNSLGPGYPEIIADLQKIKADNFVLDGELTFFKKNGQPQYLTALATSGTKAGFDIKLMMFDVQEFNGRNYRGFPLTQRLQLLSRIIPRNLKHIEVVETHTNVAQYQSIFNQIVARGGEGVVAKKKNSTYVGDSRSSWVKVKKAATEDVVVLGITEGTGKRAPFFGALVLGQYDSKGNMKAIGKSSGFDDATLLRFYKMIMEMPQHPAYPGVDIKDVKRWISPKLVIEVEYLEKTPYGILRHPRYLRIRDDKLPSQCKIQG